MAGMMVKLNHSVLRYWSRRIKKSRHYQQDTEEGRRKSMVVRGFLDGRILDFGFHRLNNSHFFAFQDGLHPIAGFQFVKNIAQVIFYSTFGNYQVLQRFPYCLHRGLPFSKSVFPARIRGDWLGGV